MTAVGYREGSIFVECRFGIWVLSLRGEHDISTEPSLSEQLGRVTAVGGPVIIDLSDADFIDSSILRVLANAAVERSAGLQVAVVIPPDRDAMRILRVTGIAELLERYETCEAAMASFAPVAPAGRPSPPAGASTRTPG
jgi:anti-anti-sigma factor